MSYCIYLRKSRADNELEAQSKIETLARHEKTLLDLARKMNLTITAIYREVVSGETISARPEVKKLISEVEQGKWEGVLVMEIERLARGNTKDQGIIAEAFQYSDTKIITPIKTYNPNNEFDEEYFEFGLFMSRREYKAINRRIQRGRVASANEGKFLGSTPPYGYKKIKLKGEKGYSLEIIEEQAETVKLIFSLYTKGKKLSGNVIKPYGLNLIAKELDTMGIVPLVSKQWSPSSIKTILTNPVYIGKIRWSYDKEIKKTENGIIKKTRIKNENCILVDGKHKAIIDKMTYAKAQEILSGKKIYPIVSNKQLKNPFSGIMYCAMCGSLMTRRISHKRERFVDYIACPNRYCKNVSTPIEIAEKGLIKSTQEWLDKYKLTWEKKAEKEYSDNLDTERKKILKFEDELKKLKKQIDNTYDLLEQGVYTIDKFKERNKILADKKSNLEDNLKKHKIIYLEASQNKQITTAFIPNMEKLIDTYLTLDNAKAKNDFLIKTFSRIEYTKTVQARKGQAESAEFNIVVFPLLPKQ